MGIEMHCSCKTHTSFEDLTPKICELVWFIFILTKGYLVTLDYIVKESESIICSVT